METNVKSFFRYFPNSERDRKWGLYVTTAGESRIGPYVRYPPPGHPRGYTFDWSHGRVLQDHQVIYISKGRGWFESKQTRRLVIESGSVFLLFPGVWHRYTPDPETGWHEHWLGFNGEIARRWVKHAFFSPEQPLLRTGHEDSLLAMFTNLFEVIRANQPALQQVLAGATAQILGLLYSAQQAGLAGDDKAVVAVQKAIGQMQIALSSKLDMPTLSRQLNVSYRWFRRTFARHTGLSPHHYLLELRLARARRLLAETSLGVKTVAEKSGFDDEHYFCRIFKRKIGRTPSQWRKRAQRLDRAQADGELG